jgi:hypothetical protein
MVGASAYCLTIDSSNVSGVSEGAAALLMRGQMGNELGPERLEGFFDRPFYTRNKRSLFHRLIPFLIYRLTKLLYVTNIISSFLDLSSTYAVLIQAKYINHSQNAGRTTWGTTFIPWYPVLGHLLGPLLGPLLGTFLVKATPQSRPPVAALAPGTCSVSYATLLSFPVAPESKEQVWGD